MSNKNTPVIPESVHRCIVAALQDAGRRRHEYITLEHLLLAMLSEKRTREILLACGARLDPLRLELETYLGARVERLPGSAPVEPRQTIGFRRVLSQAMWRAQVAEQSQLESGDLLAALLDEHDSHARFLLEQQGVTRLDVLNFISHGITRAQGAPQPAGETEEGEAPAPDPLAAYTTELVALAAAGRIDPLIGRAA